MRPCMYPTHGAPRCKPQSLTACTATASARSRVTNCASEGLSMWRVASSSAPAKSRRRSRRSHSTHSTVIDTKVLQLQRLTGRLGAEAVWRRFSKSTFPRFICGTYTHIHKMAAEAGGASSTATRSLDAISAILQAPNHFEVRRVGPAFRCASSAPSAAKRRWAARAQGHEQRALARARDADSLRNSACVFRSPRSTCWGGRCGR
jgi:hypothetical protein